MVMAGREMRENRARRKVREIGLGEKCQRGLCEVKGQGDRFGEKGQEEDGVRRKGMREGDMSLG